jgi:RimJ/RimL family protein N-acetyltransferase
MPVLRPGQMYEEVVLREGRKAILRVPDWLGKALMGSLLQLAKQAGLKVIILDMFATNTAARRLYESVGFVEVGKIPKAIHRDGKYIDLVRFAIEI